MFKYSRKELIGENIAILIEPDARTSFKNQLAECGSNKSNDYLSRTKNDEFFWAQYELSKPSAKTYSNTLIASIINIEQRKHLEHKLEKLAMEDSLTSLYNRKKFDELINIEIERSKRYSSPSAIVLIDVDNYKSINDLYGHNKGDDVLKYIAQVLKERKRVVDYAFRWGGDEFLLLLPQTSVEHAFIIISEIKEKISHYKVQNNDFKLTISAGISAVKETAMESIHEADKALYAAKAKGKNQIIYTTTNKSAPHGPTQQFNSYKT